METLITVNRKQLLVNRLFPIKYFLLTILFAINSSLLTNNCYAQVVNSQSFDGTTFPPNWWTLSGANPTYLFRTTSGTNPTQAPHAGAGEVDFDSWDLTSGSEELITPVIDWTGRGAGTPTVSFWFYRDKTAYNSNPYNAEGVNVYVNTTTSLTGATLLGFVPRRAGETPAVTTTGWYNYSYNIPATYSTCTNYIIFDFVSAYGDNCFMDDVSYVSYPTSACNCTLPTAQPTALTFPSISSTFIAGSFTAASPTCDGYFVVQTTSSTAPTNPTNGTTYAVGSAALGGTIVASGSATTFTATGLTQGTPYWYWVYAMNYLCGGTSPEYYTTSPLSGTATTKIGVNWIGIGAGGAGTDFNTAANWSPAVVPGAADEAIINTTATTAIITLSANATVGSIVISDNGCTPMALDAQTHTLTINGDFTANEVVGGGGIVSIRVGNGGSIIVGGNTYLSNNTNVIDYLEVNGSGGASSTGTITFKGDVTFGDTYFPTGTSTIGKLIWDGTGAQTIFTNNAYVPLLNANCQIGNANTPTVTVSNAYPGGVQTYDAGMGLTINAGATLDLNTTTWNQQAATGAFINNGTLRLAANTGGQTGSNFPLNYTNTLAATSTVEYYGTVAQTIFATPAYGNLTVTNNSIKTAGAALTVAGATTINSTATLAASTFTHNFKGNFINNGTFTASTGTAIFNGTAAQTIGGSSITTFNNLTIANTSATGVILATSANVSTLCTFTSGLLNTTATNILTMQNGSTVAPAFTSANTSYVNGPMVYQMALNGNRTLNFPIGTSPDCRPVALTLTHSTASLYNYTAQLFNAPAFSAGTYTNFPATVDTMSGVHYYSIARTNSVSVSTPTLDLSGNQQIQIFFGANDQVYDGSLTTVCKTYTNTTDWADIGRGGISIPLTQSVSPETGSITSSLAGPTAFNSFSYFALGRLAGAGKNPLPIQLISFSAVPNDEKVDIKWETATEENNAYFTIEKSKDGINFTKLIDVPGAGNSTTYRNYAETDYQPYSGTSYYRLKQTDYNNNYKYFNIVPVNFNINAQPNIVVGPNPLDKSSALNVNVNGYQNQEVLVVLSDMQGREFLSKVLLITTATNQVFVVDETQSLAPGTYIVTASSNDKIYNFKLIVKD